MTFDKCEEIIIRYYIQEDFGNYHQKTYINKKHKKIYNKHATKYSIFS